MTLGLLAARRLTVTVTLAAALVAQGACSSGGGSNNDGSTGGTTGTGGTGGNGSLSLTVDASQNLINLAGCTGLTPAAFTGVASGSHTISLSASTLSKGLAAGTGLTNPPASVDSFVLVSLPLPAGDSKQDHRFFMLNGIGGSYDFNLPATGDVQVMFVDSDATGNSGTATVGLAPDGTTTTVDAAANVLAWDSGCNAVAAKLDLSTQAHTITLASSTLADADTGAANYVLLRIPDETIDNPHRFVTLNGVGATYDFTPFNSTTLYAWAISSSPGMTGSATLTISNP
jgi:hypothetical protein